MQKEDFIPHWDLLIIDEPPRERSSGSGHGWRKHFSLNEYPVSQLPPCLAGLKMLDLSLVPLPHDTEHGDQEVQGPIRHSAKQEQITTLCSNILQHLQCSCVRMCWWYLGLSSLLRNWASRIPALQVDSISKKSSSASRKRNRSWWCDRDTDTRPVWSKRMHCHPPDFPKEIQKTSDYSTEHFL